MAGIATIAQTDFSAGEQSDIDPRLIDERGFLRATNTLLDNDGDAYKRGGSVALTEALNESMRWVWEGFLHPGRRSVVASPGKFGVVNPDGTSIQNLGPPGLREPRRAAQLAELLFLGGGLIYGGSRKGADYDTGTVTLTNGSATVIGSGTSWTTNVDPGMLFRATATERVYVVEAVISDTDLVLADAYEGSTRSGEAGYALQPLARATSPYVTSDFYTVAGGRLFAVVAPNIVRFTSINTTTGHSLPHVFEPDNFHNVPEGVEIIGIDSLGEDVVIFTTQGIWTITGVAYNLIDALGNPLQSLQRVSGDLILWRDCGIGHYRDALVVPCLDGVYIVDGRNAPVNVANSIKRSYRAYVNAGYRPGGAIVYRGHYFLPILSHTYKWVDHPVCRLDRPIRNRGQTSWPWSRLSGGARVAALAARASSDSSVPRLLGANAEDGKLTDLSKFMDPDASVSTDHDGSDIALELITRYFPTSEGGPGRARDLKLLYTMIAAAGNPQIYADIGIPPEDVDQAQWDEVQWDDFQWAGDALQFASLTEPQAGYGPDDAENKAHWYSAQRAPFVWYRLRSSDPVARLTLHALEVGVIPSGGNRLTRVS